MFRRVTRAVLQRANHFHSLSPTTEYLKNLEVIKCPLQVPVQHFQNTPFHQSNDEVEKDSSLLGKVGVKMRILFSCNKCNTRNDKLMSKQAYEKGIVLVRCDGCQNLHLIADNLDWFQNPHGRNIEEILASKGEEVQRVSRECLVVGASASLQKTISPEDVRVFSELTGDWNPIHHQKNKPIVHGALLNGLVSGLMGSKLPGPGTVLVKEFLRFPNPCYVGDTVTVTITLADVKKIITCKFLVVSNVYMPDCVLMEGEAKLLIK